MRLEVIPSDFVLIGDPVAIKVVEVKNDVEVTLHVRRKYFDGDIGYAYASYYAIGNIVDTSVNETISGSYNGIDISGLFWAQESTEFEVGIIPDLLGDIDDEYNGYYIIDVEIDGKIIDTHYLKLTDSLDDVKCIEVNEGNVRGKIFYKESDSPQRLMIHVAGEAGILATEVNAKLLASKGVATFALPFYRYFDLPKKFQEIPLEYFKEAIEVVKKYDFIDECRIGIMGSTRGGELSLLLASYFKELKLVIASNPSFVVNQSVETRLMGSKSSWKYKGKGLPYSKISKKSLRKRYVDKSLMQKSGLRINSLYQHNPLDDPNSLIPVEDIKGSVLLLSGEDDCRWDSKYMSEKIIEKLRNNDFKNYAEMKVYREAGQVLGGPGFLPTVCLESLTFSLGGTPQGNGIAQYESWLDIIKFIEERL